MRCNGVDGLFTNPAAFLTAVCLVKPEKNLATFSGDLSVYLIYKQNVTRRRGAWLKERKIKMLLAGPWKKKQRPS
jgi:hypothetical protein